MRVKKFLSQIYMTLIFIFMYAPIVTLIVFSFNENKGRRWSGFSLKWYQEMFQSEMIMSALWNTILIAFISAALATLLGVIACIGINSLKGKARNAYLAINNIPMLNSELVTGLAMMLLFIVFGIRFGYTTIIIASIATVVSTLLGTISAIGLSKSRKFLQKAILQLNDFPIMNPEIVTAIGLMLLFITFHVERGFWTMLLAHIAFCTPYVILSVMPKIRSLDPNLADAAMDLGATPWQALTKVLVPQIMPGIVSGALIAFTMSFDDFIISYFVTGGGVKNLSIMVYTMSRRVNPSINAISTLVVVLITIVLVIINVVPVIRERREKRHEKITG